MASPLRDLRFLPWRALIQIAALALVIVTVLEFLVIRGAQDLLPVQSTLKILQSPLFQGLLPLIGGTGLGALSVYLLERVYPQLAINQALLWALGGCVFLGLMVKYFLSFVLPIPILVIDWNQTVVLGAIVGIFWKGRPYWYR